MRWQYQLNRRLRRGLVALAVVFTLGIFCPLSCAIHCALLDMLYGEATMAGHHHSGHGTPPTTCQLMGEGGDPAHTPLAPAFYELAPMALARWLPALALQGVLIAVVAPWSSQRTRPPLRPPRAI